MFGQVLTDPWFGSQKKNIAKIYSLHYLVHLWQTVLENLEDPIAASVLTSFDYSKDFNRLDFGYCLRALANKGHPRR